MSRSCSSGSCRPPLSRKRPAPSCSQVRPSSGWSRPCPSPPPPPASARRPQRSQAFVRSRRAATVNPKETVAWCPPQLLGRRRALFAAWTAMPPVGLQSNVDPVVSTHQWTHLCHWRAPHPRLPWMQAPDRGIQEGQMLKTKPHHSNHEDDVDPLAEDDPTTARLDLLSAYTMFGTLQLDGLLEYSTRAKVAEAAPPAQSVSRPRSRTTATTTRSPARTPGGPREPDPAVHADLTSGSPLARPRPRRTRRWPTSPRSPECSRSAAC